MQAMQTVARSTSAGEIKNPEIYLPLLGSEIVQDPLR